MLRPLVVCAAVMAVLAAGLIAIPQVAQAQCPPGYPVNCGTHCCQEGFVCVGEGCCEPGFTVFCGTHCCREGFVCVGEGCCQPGYAVFCGEYCCKAGQECCEDGCCPKGAGRSCSECGEALMNDIAYGLENSKNLRNYVHEAHQNYANCIRDIQDGCANTCGRQLYDLLPGCDQWNDAGFRACVETSLRGAILSCP